MSKQVDEKVVDLNLLLLFLSGWEEESRRSPGEKIFRAWKGYLFEVLNTLEEGEMIEQLHDTKSVVLTPTGIQRAKELKGRFM